MTAIPHVAGAASHWGHFPELSPARTEAVLTLAGAPSRPLRTVLHLGCGRGVAVAILAACGVAAFGQTAREDEAADAARLAQAAHGGGSPGGAGAAGGRGRATIFREDLAAFCARTDLPLFDLIAMPEGWSATSEEERDAVVGLLARRLAPGGAFLLVHEVQPGAAEETPLRQLARNRWDALPDALAEDERAAQALAGLDAALRQCHGLFRGYGGFDAQMAELRALPPALAARRWFAARWAPATIRETARRLAPAGLRRAFPADPARLLPDLDFTEPQAALIEAARGDGRDPFLAEELADLVSRRLRRADLFVRDGGGPPAPPEALRVMRVVPAGTRDLRVSGLLGEAALSRAAYGPVLDALEDGAPRDLARIAEAAGLAAATAAQRIAALIAAGAVAPAAREASDPAATRALNLALAAGAAQGGGARAMASAALQDGVALGADEMLLAGALLGGAPEEPAALAAAAARLSGPEPGSGAGPGGDPLRLAALRRAADDFVHLRVGDLRRLKVL